MLGFLFSSSFEQLEKIKEKMKIRIEKEVGVTRQFWKPSRLMTALFQNQSQQPWGRQAPLSPPPQEQQEPETEYVAYRQLSSRGRPASKDAQLFVNAKVEESEKHFLPYGNQVWENGVSIEPGPK